LLLFILFLAAEIYPQWVQTNGPYGGYVTALAVSGNNIFAGTGGFTYEGGIYRSTNNGENWIEVTNGLTNKWINKIAIYTENKEDTIIFAGTQFGGVFRSTNWGESWVEVNSGLPDNKWITSFGFHGNNIFTGLHYGGVYCSTDYGLSWRYSGFSDKNITAFASDGTNLFASAWYDSPNGGGGVFLSTDAGKNWTEPYSGVPSIYVANIVITNNGLGGTNLFASTSEGLFLSTDNGANWAYISNLFFNEFAVSGTNLFANSGDGVYFSTDKGKSWTSIGPKNKDIRAIAVKSGNMDSTNIFVGSAYNGGVSLSTDIGKSWKEVNNGISHTNVIALASFSDENNNTNILAGTMNNGAFLSNNNGKNWLPIDFGLTDPYGTLGLKSFIVIGQNIFVGAAGGLFLSTDLGKSWMSDSGIFFYHDILSFASNGTCLFAGTYDNGIFRTTNNGASWSKANLVLPSAT